MSLKTVQIDWKEVAHIHMSDIAASSRIDDSRLTAVIEKARKFMSDYVAPITPLDLPESSPKELSSGPGKKGI